MKTANSLLVLATVLLSTACSSADVSAEESVGSFSAALTDATAAFSKTSGNSDFVSLTNCQVEGQPQTDAASESQVWTYAPSATSVAAARIDTAIASGMNPTIDFGFSFSGSKMNGGTGSASFNYQVYHVAAAGVKTLLTSNSGTLSTPASTPRVSFERKTGPISVRLGSAVNYTPGDAFTIEYQASMEASCDAALALQFSGLFNFSPRPTLAYTY